MALVLTTPRKSAINRPALDEKTWRPAVAAAGIVPTRATGMHALRHFYASSLLDAGESIKALAEYLGHSDPGFTLRVYTRPDGVPSVTKTSVRPGQDRYAGMRPTAETVVGRVGHAPPTRATWQAGARMRPREVCG